MISANKIAKLIRQNGSPPATLPAKELCESPHEATEFFWECTFRASDHCQQMREREMPIICKFTATSFQRGLESQRTARSSAQVQTWVGRGLVDRGKEGEKRDRGKCGRVVAQRQWSLRQPGDRKPAAGFSGRFHDSVGAPAAACPCSFLQHV